MHGGLARAGLCALAILLACGRKAPEDPYLADHRQRAERVRPEVEREIGRKLGKVEFAVLAHRRIAEDRIPWWRERLARIENGPRGEEVEAEVRARADDYEDCAATVDSSGRIILPDPTEERTIDMVAGRLPPSVFDKDLRARDLLLVHEMVHVHQIRHLEAGFWGSIRSRADIRARMAVLEGHAEYVTRRIASRIGLSDLYDEYHSSLEPGGHYVQGERFVAFLVERLGYADAIRRIFSSPPTLAAVSQPELYFTKAESSRWSHVSEDLRRWLARERGEASLHAVPPSRVREAAGAAADGLREGFYLDADPAHTKLLLLVAEDEAAACELHRAWTTALEGSHARKAPTEGAEEVRFVRKPDHWTLHHTAWPQRNVRQVVVREGAFVLDVQCDDSELEQAAERLARRALRFMTDPAWREAWLKGDGALLKSEEPGLRLAAVSRMRRFVADEDWEVRWLGRFYEVTDEKKDEAERTAAVVAAIEDPHPAVTARGLRAAADMRLWHVPWPVLRERLGDTEVAVRRAAWDLMDTQIDPDDDQKEWQVGGPETVDLIAKALDDEDSTVRVAAVDCLSEVKEEPGLELLFRKALMDEHRRVRVKALITLSVYKLAFPELLPEIVDLIDDLPDVAAKALGHLGQGGVAALPRLHEIVGGTQGRAEAAAAIWKISGDAEPLFTLVTESVGRGEPQGFEELGEMGAAAEAAVADIAKALAHENRWVRIAAAQALGSIGGPEAKEALKKRLEKERDPKVLEALKKAVAEIKDGS